MPGAAALRGSSLAALDPRARQFQSYLKWAGMGHLPGVVGLFALYLVYDHAYLLLWTGVTIINWGLYALASRRVGTHGVADAAPMMCYGIWLIILVGILTERRGLIVGILLSIMPLVAIAPYARKSDLLKQCLIAVGLNAAYAISSTKGWSPDNSGLIPDGPYYLFHNIAVVVCVIVGCFSIWNSSRILNRSIAELAEGNDALRGTGRELERRVKQRTESLRESRLLLSRARDTALTSSRHKSDFVANMSHELRTPLNAIIGFSDALASQAFGTLSPRQASYVDDVRQSSRELLDLINNLLEQARIFAGRYQLECRATSIIEFSSSAVSAMQATAKAKGVSLELLLPEQDRLLQLDPHAMGQALRHVLYNAIAQSPPGESVKLEVDVREGYLIVAVTDAGPPIAEQDLSKVFETFGAGRPLKQSGPSAGLGLALARDLVVLHGGTMKVSSDAPRGARFRMEVPATAPGAAT